MRAFTAALFVAMFLFVSHSQGPVHGYLDPGTGSMALQLILGWVVALLATAKLYWARLRTLVGRKPTDSDATMER